MYTPENICRLVVSKVEAGLTQRTIANQLNISQSAVSRIINRYRRTGQFTPFRPSTSGRRPSLSARSARLLARQSVANPQFTARQIQRAVGGESSQVSTRTVQRYLVRQGRISYRPVKSPNWNASQRSVRLKWARDHSSWTKEQWKQVFTNH